MKIQKMSITFILTFTVMFMAIPSFAGLIDYSKRKASTKAKAAETPKAKQMKKAKMKQENHQSTFRVASRSEKIYDSNGDNWLQREEVVEYYTDVIKTVNRRGSFKATENLKKFDTDEDGRIGYHEAAAMRKFLK